MRNLVNHQIKTTCEGSRMKNRRSRVLRKLLNTIKSEGNSFQVSRSFRTKERSKTGRKRNKDENFIPRFNENMCLVSI